MIKLITNSNSLKSIGVKEEIQFSKTIRNIEIRTGEKISLSYERIKGGHSFKAYKSSQKKPFLESFCKEVDFAALKFFQKLKNINWKMKGKETIFINCNSKRKGSNEKKQEKIANSKIQTEAKLFLMTSDDSISNMLGHTYY